MPTEPKEELAIQQIVTRLQLIKGGAYHTTLDDDNIVRQFRNPLDVIKSDGVKGFPLVQVVGPFNVEFVTGTSQTGGGDWNRISDVQGNTDLEIYCAVLGSDSATQLLRLRQDIIQVLSNDFTLGGNTHDWFPVRWEAGYAWEKQTSLMGTSIFTIRLVWTYRKASP
jgi:hypothetical protein